MPDDLKFTVQRPPPYGELTDVLPGLFWVRLPVPLTLNHVNCWLLDKRFRLDAGRLRHEYRRNL